MGKLKHFLWLALLLLLLPAEAATTDFNYTLLEDSVLITEYVGNSADVVVPATMHINGVDYPVVMNGSSVFANNAKIRSVKIESGVAFQDGNLTGLFMNCSNLETVELRDAQDLTLMTGVFYQCPKLTRVDLTGLDTSQVTNMNYLFCGCSALETIVGYEDWDTSSVWGMYMAFLDTYSLTRVDLSRWDLSQLKNSGWCFQYCGASEILLPDSIAAISAGFFNHVNQYPHEVFTVPEGVTTIGLAHTFYDFGTGLKAFAVAEGNTACKAVDDILYSADGTILYAVPEHKTFPDGVFTIPEGVTMIGELSFSRNENIRELVLPDSYEISWVDVCDPRYITNSDRGNLNGGNSLNIAVYVYAGVTRYAVHPTNPNYLSEDGVIYTKDLTSLVAVPIRYDGYIQIPQGVTCWEKDAMWSVNSATADGYMANASGVFIPESLTYIEENQLRKLNRLQKQGFEITVDEKNPVYRVNSKGQLVERKSGSNASVLWEDESPSGTLPVWLLPAALGLALVLTLGITAICFLRKRR